MLTEPKVVQRADQPYVAITALVTMETLGAVVPPLNREVFGWLGARGGAATGAPAWPTRPRRCWTGRPSRG
jgi:hypothetical protein